MPSWAATYATTFGGTFGWLGQERAQEPSGGQLQREPELVLRAAPHFDQFKVGIVEVKVALELLVRGWSDVVLGSSGRPHRSTHGARSCVDPPGPPGSGSSRAARPASR